MISKLTISMLFSEIFSSNVVLNESEFLKISWVVAFGIGCFEKEDAKRVKHSKNDWSVAE